MPASVTALTVAGTSDMGAGEAGGRARAQAWRGGHCYRSTTLQDSKLPGSAVFGEGKSKAFARVVRYIEGKGGRAEVKARTETTTKVKCRWHSDCDR